MERNNSGYKVQNLVPYFIRMCSVGTVCRVQNKFSITEFLGMELVNNYFGFLETNPHLRSRKICFKSMCKTQQKISGSGISQFSNQVIHAVSLLRKALAETNINKQL
jgi:hypothetical protein